MEQLEYKDNNNYYKYKVFNYKINIIHPLIEIKRFNELNKINKLLQNINENLDIFNFIITLISLNKNNLDPLIPSKITKEDLKIYKKYIDVNKKQCDIITKECLTSINNVNIYVKNNFNNDTYKFKKTINKNLIELQVNDIRFIIPDVLYNKMINKFELVKNKSIKYNLDNISLDELLWCIIYRYNILNLWNSIQLAVLPSIYEELITKFNCKLELFGSAMNHTIFHFCSLFYDLEKYFGSIGNFFNVELIKGFYLVNPPFDFYIMNETCKKIINSLNKNKHLSFFVTIPVWDNNGIEIINKNCNGKKKKIYKTDFEGYKLLKKNKHLIFNNIYCKENFKYFDYLNYKELNVAPTHVIILSNIYKKIVLSSLKKFKHITISQNGGSNNYYNKYMKYKFKYLYLKNINYI